MSAQVLRSQASVYRDLVAMTAPDEDELTNCADLDFRNAAGDLRSFG